jgi:DNA-binding LacI/PurR family transcriptional regulator
VAPTLRDVAVRANVSVATVSRALSGSPVVSPQLRERVTEVADDLGYVANRLPANLRARNARFFALVVGNVRNAYFPELIDGAVEAAHQAGYPLIFGDSNEDPDRESEILQQLALERVSGVALATCIGLTSGLKRLLKLGIPVVAVDRRVPDLPMDTVTSDGEAGVYEMMRHLLALGHRRIGLMGGPVHLSTIADREAGYRRGLRDAGIEVDQALIVRGDLLEQTARTLLPRLMSVERPPTALVTINDLSTIGTLHGLRDLGLRVPDDVSVVGFDDPVGGDLFDPPLTTVAQPVFTIGRQAVELLARRAAQPEAPPEELLLPTRLVVRSSTAPSQIPSTAQEVSPTERKPSRARPPGRMSSPSRHRACTRSP